MVGRLTGTEPWVKIDGKPYVVAMRGGSPVFSSAERAIENVPSDDWEIVYDDFSGGVGQDFYTGDDFLTTVKGKLYLRPTVTTIYDLFNADFVQDWFESGDYLYAVATRMIYKFDISVNPPVLSRAYGPFYTTTPFAAGLADRPGITALMYSARTSGYRRYIPCNNGTRIMALDAVSTEGSQAFSPVVTLNGAINASVTSIVYTSAGDAIIISDVIIIESERMWVWGIDAGTNTLDVIRGWAGTTAATHADTTAITQATPDTLTLVTAVTTGASHFQQMPDGKIWRSIASRSSGTAQNVAKVSALPAGADCEVNANWGGAFPIDDQTVPIISLMNYDELLVVGTEKGWFTAVQNSDGTLTWRSLLPDASLARGTIVTAPEEGYDPWGRGTVWHGKMLLPTNTHLWRHTLSSAVPIGPDAIPENTGDEAAAATAALRYGYISGTAGIGEWVYAPYTIPGVSTEVLAGHEARSGEVHELPWDLMFKTTGVHVAKYAGVPYIQKTGVGAPRLWVHTVQAGPYSTFDWVSLSADGGPYSSALTYGNDGITARLYLMPKLFPSSVLIRECWFVLENGVATCTWGLELARDGGSAAAFGSTVTATGSLFPATPGTNDTCRRVQPIIKAVTSGYTPTATPPRVLQVKLLGTYLPDVADELLFVVDVAATAKRRGCSQKQVVSELKGYRNSGALAFIDSHIENYSQSGYILITSAFKGAPKHISGLLGQEFVQVKGRLLEQS